MATSEEKKNADELIEESPTLLNKRANRVSHGLFKSHMQSVQKQVSFKDERTISNGRMLTVSEYDNPTLKQERELTERLRTSYEEKQVPPLQMPRL